MSNNEQMLNELLNETFKTLADGLNEHVESESEKMSREFQEMLDMELSKVHFDEPVNQQVVIQLSTPSNNQEIKADAGKPKLTLVPTQIIYDIARVREFGVAKYGKKESWKSVEIERYRDALFRHLLLYINDPQGVDEESGLPHLSHVACNVAFLCELEKEVKDGKSMGQTEHKD